MDTEAITVVGPYRPRRRYEDLSPDEQKTVDRLVRKIKRDAKTSLQLRIDLVADAQHVRRSFRPDYFLFNVFGSDD